MLPDKWLSRYGLMKNYTVSVMGMVTGTTRVTTIALCTSCNQAKNDTEIANYSLSVCVYH